MSYEEKNITVSLTSFTLILGYYLFNIFQMIQGEGLIKEKLFSLWAVVIIAGILINIIASILTNIILSIVQSIRTRTETVERFIADERDKWIELKGIRFSYITFSVGVLISMLTFVFGQPPLVMFSSIIFFSILAEVIGDISQLFLYRRGF